MFGLSNEIYSKIIEIVKKYNYDFFIFGSRARGDYKNNSDIDIAIYGQITEKEEMMIRNDFDMLQIPYTIDLVFIIKIEKEELLKSIKKEGIKLQWTGLVKKKKIF